MNLLSNIYDIVIIGGGPAGLISGISAMNKNKKILILESGMQCGKKLLLTGGTRCNFTHLDKSEEILSSFGKNKFFLKHALFSFPPKSVINFFQDIGINSYSDDKGNIYPVSDKSSDILRAL